MSRPSHVAVFALVLASCLATVSAQPPAFTDAANAGPDYAVQGEYVGEITAGDSKITVGVQIVALGDGKFEAVSHIGGLPGAGWNEEGRITAEGQRSGDSTVFDSPMGRGVLKDGIFRVEAKDAVASGELNKVARVSPTLEQQPPADAIVLFDGTNADAFQGGRMSDDGLLMQGCVSQQRFGDHQLHIEFLLPFQPTARGQARGNSGVYLQGRYEVQMLDSFGLEGKQNECGGLYSVAAPRVNMCFPPLTWQTYDIDFTAAKYDGDQLVAPPRITVRHNGVVVHDDVQLPGDRGTTAAPVKPGPEPGPVYLQDHGNPVRYRNIWVIEK